ncbi:hypothetical protein [Jeotgalibacillus terrae]|uniref:Uncharacterized protein n=1 Tax=Jeotgalibacillus terrae TaxID=587735 RepID=A0ABW5ZC67_9BACL|nr:hypothetical protein [Jeotgalibacillus terrae]MBM7580130.1 hypothetical protein [Jeotgalibacillus terrae]
MSLHIFSDHKNVKSFPDHDGSWPLSKLKGFKFKDVDAVAIIGLGEEKIENEVISSLWEFTEGGGILYAENLAVFDFPTSRLLGFKQDFSQLARTNEKLIVEPELCNELNGYLLEWKGTYQKGYCTTGVPLLSVGVFKDTHRNLSGGEKLPALTYHSLGKGRVVYAAFPLFGQTSFMAYRPNYLWNRLLKKVSEKAGIEFPSIRNPIKRSDLKPAESIERVHDWFLKSGIMPKIDGTEGVYENIHSFYQQVSMDKRPDCHAQSAIMFYLYGKYKNDDASKERAFQLINYLIREGYQDNDPSSASYGFWKWFQYPGTLPEDMFTDDNSWVTIALLFLYKETGIDIFRERGMLTAEALFRTQHANGLRPENYKGSLLRSQGDRYINSLAVSMNPHFESIAHTAFILAYQVSGDEKFLKTAYMGTVYLLNHLNEIKWMYSKTSAYARFSLAISGLLKFQDDEKLRDGLSRVMDYLISHQHSSGGVEEADNPDPERYGYEDTGVYIYNGEGIADLLYTNNFMLMNVWEAWKQTGNEYYFECYRKLRDFLVNVQIESDSCLYHGGWMRAYDLNYEEYFGNNGDTGWGPYCMESGWTNGVIGTGLLLGQMNMSLFDDVHEEIREADLQKASGKED